MSNDNSKLASSKFALSKFAPSRSGFTLIEMMAVMMIIASVASLALTFIPGTGRAGLKAITMDTVALLRRERQGAIMTGSERHVSLDSAQRILIGDGGGQVIIPPDVTIDIMGANANWAGRLAVAAFHPDGASSGAALKLSREGMTYEIHVNWYTGGVAIETN